MEIWCLYSNIFRISIEYLPNAYQTCNEYISVKKNNIHIRILVLHFPLLCIHKKGNNLKVFFYALSHCMYEPNLLMAKKCLVSDNQSNNYSLKSRVITSKEVSQFCHMKQHIIPLGSKF